MVAQTFASFFIALLVAHQLADHWVQTSHQAAHKAAHSWHGRYNCFKHVFFYTLVTAGFGGLVWVLLSLQITVTGFLLGQLVSGITHYWADRRHTLAWLARLVNKHEFYSVGSPREGKDDNSTLGTGSYVLDQSFHWFWLFVAALITALV